MATGKLDFRKLAALPSFYFTTLSHDKKKLAYYYDKTGIIELYVMDLDTRKTKQVSDGQIPRMLGGFTGIRWDRNNREIYFTKDKGGNEQHDIYKINTENGETTQLTNTPNAQEMLSDTSPDGEWISFNSNRNGQMNVFKMRTDGSEVTQITATDNPSYGGHFHPEMKYLAFSTNEEGNMLNEDIYLIDLETGDPERVVQLKEGSKENFTDWSKDGKSFYFSTDVDETMKVGVYYLETKSIEFFGEDIDNDIYPLKMTDDGSKLICVINKNSSYSPLIFDIKTKHVEYLEFPEGIASGSNLIDDRYLLLYLEQTSFPGSYILYDLVEKTTETLISPELGDIDPELFVKAEHIWYDSKDGTKIPAIISRPRNMDPAKKYPAIVMPHGGPTAQHVMAFRIYNQILPDMGIILLRPNVRGSTGYGVKFRDACIKDWGGKDHEDWKAAHKYLVEYESADPDRIGVMGGSYGGYATLWCMTNSPDLWKMGIAEVPVSHLHNLYNGSMDHFKDYFKQQMRSCERERPLGREKSLELCRSSQSTSTFSTW
ncbi:MAG: S9 family peptidase [Candidatus Heimdallarchaeota archaeon]|nr:S9 family peptidase [Candidatus Heimdallarchaeota archaeon]